LQVKHLAFCLLLLGSVLQLESDIDIIAYTVVYW